MKEYFKSKIGQTIRHRLHTGIEFYTEVYERQYGFEVLSVKGNKVTFEVTSNDITPSGMLRGGSENYFGECVVDIKEKSKADILKEVIKRKDREFDLKYGVEKCFQK